MAPSQSHTGTYLVVQVEMEVVEVVEEVVMGLEVWEGGVDSVMAKVGAVTADEAAGVALAAGAVELEVVGHQLVAVVLAC